MHFRISPELRDALDAVVDRLRSEGVPATRSSVARSLLHEQLGMDLIQSQLQETLGNVWGATQLAMGRLTKSIGEQFPAFLEEAHQELISRARRSE